MSNDTLYVLLSSVVKNQELLNSRAAGPIFMIVDYFNLYSE